MKTTKFNLDFKTVEARLECKSQASKAGKSMNQYILDCIKVYNPIEEKLKRFKEIYSKET